MGKASLLQSLTDIPYHVTSSFCTPRIVSRRAPGVVNVTKISIEAIFGDALEEEGLESLRLRYVPFAQISLKFTAGDFKAAFEEVSLSTGPFNLIIQLTLV